MNGNLATTSEALTLEPDGEPLLDIVIPVYNEEIALVGSVETVRAQLKSLGYSYRVTIADNASTDATSLLAHQLAHRYPDVRVLSLTRKGRGHALKEAWSRSEAAVLVYMDVDLSTDLNALLPLVAPLLSGHSDLAIGSRLARSSRTTRGPKREVISRSYNLLLRSTLRTRFTDAQCGFKAIRRDVAARLLPLIEDDEWFFDTELLVVAERAGLRIHEVPVDWVDNLDSRVNILRTAAADLRGMGRLGWSLLRGRVPLTELTETLGCTTARSARGRLSAQLVIFALIGIASTVGYGLLFMLMRGQIGPQQANAAALAITAVANTAANRRFTFGFLGRSHAIRHQLQGLLVFGAGLGITSAALLALHRINRAHHPLQEVIVLTSANLVVTLLRFALMRAWIFRIGRR